ncbi:MAG: hypothetical protein LUE27_02970 [Clostridia bacterium]|nr:hypothetical protein [Clostridia bacterium]
MTRKAKKELKRIINDIGAKGYERGYYWKGYEVYEPVYKGLLYVGDPLVIFVKGDDAWLAPDDEGDEYIHYSILKIEEEKAASQG